MAYLSFVHAGMAFRIEADINKDGFLESISNPTIWNKKKRNYEPISCDLEAFQKGMEDEIAQCVEEYNSDKAKFYADWMYHLKKEEN